VAKGYFDITPSADGGVLKKVKYLPPVPDSAADSVDRVPVPGCPVSVHLLGTLLNGEIFHTTLDTHADYPDTFIGGDDIPYEFNLMREKVIRGLDIAVSTMVTGEISSFVIDGAYGYNTSLPASLPKVTANCTLLYEVSLLSFKDSIPRFPTKEELEQTKIERNEENKKFLEENPPVPYKERCDEAMKEKDLGNAHFKEGRYDDAKKCYDSGFIHVYIHQDEWRSNMMNDDDRNIINNTKAILHLNRCMCRVKMEKWDDALWDADKAIEFGPKPGNPKAYYRRMVIYTGHFKMELDKEAKGKFWDIEKGKRWQRCAQRDLNKCMELNKELAEEGSDLKINGEDAVVKKGRLELERCSMLLKKYENSYKKKQKELYSEKMMGSLNDKYKNMKLREENKLRKEEEEMDMPELDDGDDDDDGGEKEKEDMLPLPTPPNRN
jgi:tetratricopeptide (TPR) repeat protein